MPTRAPIAPITVSFLAALLIALLGAEPVRAQCPPAPVVTLNSSPCVSGPNGPNTPQVALDWTTVPGATVYEVYRSTGGAPPVDAIGISTSPTFKDNSPPIGQTLSYRVRGVVTPSLSCPAGATAYSNTVSIPAPFQPPAGAISGLTATPICAGVTVHWNAAPQAVSYRVRVAIDGVQQGSVQTTTATSIDVSTSTDAQVATVYVYMVDVCSRLGPESSVSGSRAPGGPPPPVTFSSTNVTCNGATVAWLPVPGAVRYTVRVSPENAGPSRFFTVTSPSVLIPREGDQIVRLGVFVAAVNACSVTGAEALTVTDSTVRFFPPLNFDASQAPGGISLAWSPVEGATGYRLQRIDAGGVLSIDTSLQGTTYFDPAPPAGSTLYYLYSIDTCGGRSNFPSSASLGPAPTFSVFAPPRSLRRRSGETAVFQVGITGSTPTIRWCRNGVNLSDGPNVSGSSTPTLTLSNLRVSDSDLYDVQLSRAGERPVTVPVSLIVINFCPPDFDENGTRNIDDIFIYLSAWFAGCP